MANQPDAMSRYFWEKVQLLPVFEPPEQEEIPFADFLFKEELYEEAITEYRRFLFSNPVGPSSDYARFQISLCYIRNEVDFLAQTSLTELAYNAVSHETALSALIIMALHHTASGETDRAEYELKERLRTAPSQRQSEIRYLIAWLALLKGDLPRAQSEFELIVSDTLGSPFYQKCSY
jgi:tetratricopeptide (TPR) repeat protein